MTRHLREMTREASRLLKKDQEEARFEDDYEIQNELQFDDFLNTSHDVRPRLRHEISTGRSMSIQEGAQPEWEKASKDKEGKMFYTLKGESFRKKRSQPL
ncbi:hypothetical protein B0A49_13183 [Cryomyces minteri]|uniref:Uncharacterized protein n=1 Tax=Cryomyces minteri TaxID=331657 RepID=A0A4U0VL49_9PEZI|nr:hypothetical protein B0A49_13183 [Cryomyces minteri]